MDTLATTTQLTGVQVSQQQNPLLSPGIRHNPKEDIFKVIIASLAKSYTDLGLEQPSDKDKNYLANELTVTIPKKFPSIRITEIPTAFANGIRGKYGKYYGLNVVTFENFIEAHLASEERELLAKELPKLEEKTEPDNITKFNVAKNNAIKAFQGKINGSDISLVALAVYTFLDGLKLIQFSIEEKYDFLDEARTKLKAAYELKKKTTLDKMQRLDIANRIKSIEAGKEKNLVVNAAKKLALEAFFESCIVEEINLEELIESKRDIFLTNQSK